MKKKKVAVQRVDQKGGEIGREGPAQARIFRKRERTREKRKAGANKQKYFEKNGGKTKNHAEQKTAWKKVTTKSNQGMAGDRRWGQLATEVGRQKGTVNEASKKGTLVLGIAPANKEGRKPGTQ